MKSYEQAEPQYVTGSVHRLKVEILSEKFEKFQNVGVVYSTALAMEISNAL